MAGQWKTLSLSLSLSLAQKLKMVRFDFIRDNEIWVILAIFVKKNWS